MQEVCLLFVGLLVRPAACKTTGFLSLALELLYRNTRSYLEANNLMKVPESSIEQPTSRSTRRLNAWQQANQGSGWD